MANPIVNPPVNPRLALAVAAAIVVGLALRLYAALGDFWFDEIVSLNLALQAKSAIDLLSVRSDNNHLLNTLLMYALGEQAYWPAYRLPAVIAGGVSIVMAGVLARRWGKAASIVAMTVFAVSHPLVHYGSEARGYSLAVMFMLLAMWLQMRLLTHAVPSPRPSPRPPKGRGTLIVAFWVCIALGMLSHPLFLQPYLAMLGRSLWMIGHDRSRTVPQRCLQLVSSHLAPLAVAATLYCSHWRNMEVAGGAIESPWRIIASAAALIIGAPHETLRSAAIGGVIAGALVISAITWLIRRRDDFAIFALLSILLVPAIMLLALRPDVLYERYFLLSMTVALLTVAAWLGDLVARGGALRISGAVALALVIGANLWRDRELILLGRGQYLAALEFMSAHTAGETIVVGSDHDPRTVTLLGFYVQYLGGEQVRYVPAEQWPSDDAQWFILQGRDRVIEPRSEIVDRAGLRWRLALKTDSADLSGWRWFVYQRVDAQ